MEYEETRHGGIRRTRVPQRQRTPVTREAVGSAQAMRRGKIRTVMHDMRIKYTSRNLGRGSSPSTRTWFVKLNEHLGLPTCPYLIRWRLETPVGSLRVHHWLGPDDDRHFHDHPWDFTTFVVKGGYVDKSPDGEQHLKAPTVQRRAATHQHTVYPDPGGAWTIVFTGPKVRNWGFWVAGKFKKANKYFLTFGHHPCN